MTTNIEQESAPVKCQEYYTVAFRATGNITLCCDRDECHAGLHLDRRGVFWQSTRPEPPVTEEEVEAALFDWLCTRGIYSSLDQLPAWRVAADRIRMRAALGAARATREGKNQ